MSHHKSPNLKTTFVVPITITKVKMDEEKFWLFIYKLFGTKVIFATQKISQLQLLKMQDAPHHRI